MMDFKKSTKYVCYRCGVRPDDAAVVERALRRAHLNGKQEALHLQTRLAELEAANRDLKNEVAGLRASERRVIAAEVSSQT